MSIASSRKSSNKMSIANPSPVRPTTNPHVRPSPPAISLLNSIRNFTFNKRPTEAIRPIRKKASPNKGAFNFDHILVDRFNQAQPKESSKNSSRSSFSFKS
jgi:hypothetical protein